MELDVFNTVRQCAKCAKERLSLGKHARFLKLFPAQQPLQFVAIDILGPLPRTKSGHKYLVVISDRYSKFVRTVPLKKITAWNVAKAFCDHWAFIFGPPKLLLSDITEDNLFPSSSSQSATYLAHATSSQPLTTLKQMAKWNGLIALY